MEILNGHPISFDPPLFTGKLSPSFSSRCLWMPLQVSFYWQSFVSAKATFLSRAFNGHLDSQCVSFWGRKPAILYILE